MADLFFGLIYIGIVIMMIAAWFTHVLECIASEMWGLLIAGAIFFPIGIIHGFTVWF